MTNFQLFGSDRQMDQKQKQKSNRENMKRLTLSICTLLLFLVEFIDISISLQAAQLIKIRGSGKPCEYLPLGAPKSWRIWTLSNEEGLTEVETEGFDGLTWVNPTSFSELFLPSDLNSPGMIPALGVGVTNGVLRYVMPSTILTLSTPAREWRNRGICSLPRAHAWIDLFSSFSPKYLRNLQLNLYGKVMADVRFLEDQDGSSAWEEVAYINGDAIYAAYESFSTLFNDPDNSNPLYDDLRQGFHFVDIPLQTNSLRLPRFAFKGILSDFSDPKGIIGMEDDTSLDSEPCAELTVESKMVGAGGASKFLPEVYRDLFEEGNLIG